MKIIGIDPGLNGGLAVLDANGTSLSVQPMPTLKSGKSRQEYDDRFIIEFLQRLSLKNYNAERDRLLARKAENPALHLEASKAIELLGNKWTLADIAYCEKLQPLPASMGGGIANYNRGIWRAFKWACLALEIPFVAVRPQEWQKEFQISGDTKKKAYEVASARWSDVDWRATPRCRKPHDGMVDAALIAEYGRRKEARGIS